MSKIDVYKRKGKSRNAGNHSVALSEFSAKLFRFERELLQPDVMIFGCSANHDNVVKSLFEAPTRQTVQIHVPKELWHFTHGRIDCFRTLHPAVARFGRQSSCTKALPDYYSRNQVEETGFFRRWLAFAPGHKNSNNVTPTHKGGVLVFRVAIAPFTTRLR